MIVLSYNNRCNCQIISLEDFLLALYKSKIDIIDDVFRSIPSIGSVTIVDSSTCSGMYNRLTPKLRSPNAAAASYTTGV